ncbi:MAG: hypothetical protein HY673_10540, partial [Chloroflexi bacterium]|nr:hypothetical protein [Chloroflexota bacterium]
HSLALKSDGTVRAWGLNDSGQLGNGTTTGSNVPVQVSGLSGAAAIAGGIFHSLALKFDGTVRAWGLNAYGQLGDGTTTDSNIPVQVNGLSGVVAIAAGGFHSLAIKTIPIINGDVNRDGTVNATDLTLLMASFNKRSGEPAFNPAADLNRDGIIDVYDLVTVGLNFGRTQ